MTAGAIHDFAEMWCVRVAFMCVCVKEVQVRCAISPR